MHIKASIHVNKFE